MAAAFGMSPDLILMDIALPGMSGLDAVRTIRTRPPPSDHRRQFQCYAGRPGPRHRSGCDEFVAKPIDDLSLVSLVGRLMEEREPAEWCRRCRPGRILIVDDEPLNVDYLEQELEHSAI